MEILTSRIWVDLPVFVEGPAACENRDDAGDETCDHERKPNIDGDLISAAKAVLLYVLGLHCSASVLVERREIIPSGAHRMPA